MPKNYPHKGDRLVFKYKRKLVFEDCLIFLDREFAFKFNKHYFISNFIYGSSLSLYNIVEIYDDNGELWRFNLGKNDTWYLYRFFHNLKNERKLKLENINRSDGKI